MRQETLSLKEGEVLRAEDEVVVRAVGARFQGGVVVKIVRVGVRACCLEELCACSRCVGVWAVSVSVLTCLGR